MWQRLGWIGCWWGRKDGDVGVVRLQHSAFALSFQLQHTGGMREPMRWVNLLSTNLRLRFMVAVSVSGRRPWPPSPSSSTCTCCGPPATGAAAVPHYGRRRHADLLPRRVPGADGRRQLQNSLAGAQLRHQRHPRVGDAMEQLPAHNGSGGRGRRQEGARHLL